MILYFAANSYEKEVHAAGGTALLQSFYSIRKPEVRWPFKHYLLDSGGFSARKYNIKIDVGEYAEFINKYNVTLAFNLDTNDAIETSENLAYLTGHCSSCYIVPIYHYSDYLEGGMRLLQHFISDGFPYIGLGGIAGAIFSKDKQRRFFDAVFSFWVRNKELKFHGLGVTDKKMLLNYPFYSVDSSSFSAPLRYGCTSNRDVYKRQHNISGRYFRLLGKTAIVNEVKYFVSIEQLATMVWKKRGVVWND